MDFLDWQFKHCQPNYCGNDIRFNVPLDNKNRSWLIWETLISFNHFCCLLVSLLAVLPTTKLWRVCQWDRQTDRQRERWLGCQTITLCFLLDVVCIINSNNEWIHKKLCYYRGITRRAMLVNSRYVSHGVGVRKVSAAKVTIKVIGNGAIW